MRTGHGSPRGELAREGDLPPAGGMRRPTAHRAALRPKKRGGVSEGNGGASHKESASTGETDCHTSVRTGLLVDTKPLHCALLVQRQVSAVPPQSLFPPPAALPCGRNDNGWKIVRRWKLFLVQTPKRCHCEEPARATWQSASFGSANVVGSACTRADNIRPYGGCTVVPARGGMIPAPTGVYGGCV